MLELLLAKMVYSRTAPGAALGHLTEQRSSASLTSPGNFHIADSPNRAKRKGPKAVQFLLQDAVTSDAELSHDSTIEALGRMQSSRPSATACRPTLSIPTNHFNNPMELERCGQPASKAN